MANRSIRAKVQHHERDTPYPILVLALNILDTAAFTQRVFACRHQYLVLPLHANLALIIVHSVSHGGGGSCSQVLTPVVVRFLQSAIVASLFHDLCFVSLCFATSRLPLVFAGLLGPVFLAEQKW